jgi:hypothetical protein
MNRRGLKGSGRGPVLYRFYYPNICLEGVRKIMNNLRLLIGIQTSNLADTSRNRYGLGHLPR